MVFEGYQPGYGFFNSFGALQRPLLRRGSTGEAVKELQSLLENALQMSVGVTGSFDDRTLGAVLRFQRAKSLKVDGVVGPQTWSALLGQPVDVPGATGTTGTTPNIPGTRGPAGGGPVINDGDISLEAGAAPAGKVNTTGLLVGLGVAFVAGYFLFKGRKSAAVP